MEIFRLFGTILIDSDEAQKSISKTGKEAEGLGSKLKAGISTAAKWAAGLTAAAATAVAGLTKAAVEAYAEYEQLSGGIETLFGDSADTVMEYANNAFKTAGMSANEYMELATSFSASLLQGLGGDTEEAARIADMAISDMSDNANKMGTDISSIENAYQGFAKQNYTMLDNLKLGYGGTKAEMERLLEDAEALSGVEYNIDNLNDVYEAIHVIQEEMGITGTTAEEAANTIEGSVSSMKSAWKNLVAGLADDNADIDQLISNLVESIASVGDNIMPRIESALQGIVSLIQKLVPIITEALPGLIQELLPPLLDAAITLIKALAEALPEILQIIVDMIPDLMNTLMDVLIECAPDLLVAGVQIVIQLATGIVKAIPELVAKIPELIKAIVQAFAESWPEIKESGKELFKALWDGVKEIWQKISSWVTEKVNWLIDKVAFWKKNEAEIGETDGSHASGLNYVPYDGYVAELHRGETVLTSGQSQDMASDIINGLKDVLGGGYNQPIELTLNIDGKAFARATYKDYKDEINRRGSSLVTV